MAHAQMSKCADNGGSSCTRRMTYMAYMAYRHMTHRTYVAYKHMTYMTYMAYRHMTHRTYVQETADRVADAE